MKTVRVFVMFLSAVAWFSAARARADNPDYQKVRSLALELLGRAGQVNQLAISVPQNHRYSADRQGLANGSATVNQKAFHIVNIASSGDARRDDMLADALQIRAAVDAMEDAARSTRAPGQLPWKSD